MSLRAEAAPAPRNCAAEGEQRAPVRGGAEGRTEQEREAQPRRPLPAVGEDPPQEPRLGVSLPQVSPALVTLLGAPGERGLWSNVRGSVPGSRPPGTSLVCGFNPRAALQLSEASPGLGCGVSVSPSLPGSPGERGLFPRRARSVGLREAAPCPVLPGVRLRSSQTCEAPAGLGPGNCPLAAAHGTS